MDAADPLQIGRQYRRGRTVPPVIRQHIESIAPFTRLSFAEIGAREPDENLIIWFSATELRIGFVLLMICAPITIFNVYDGIRSIDQKTTDMVKTFGANSWQMIRILLWPYVKSFAFTATKINVGVGVRVVIVAELVGAPSGIGKELDLAKSLFEMPLILAWTLWMIIVLLLLETVVEWLEGRVLKWRVEEGGKM
ncbi:MAG: ABC transporter permease subunit [Nitrospinota bacterium]|nr:ABC transporter permease subunit [Nitrospinota bacterium]